LMLTIAQQTAILVDMHRAIEAAATEVSRAVTDGSSLELTYPPNAGFTSAERSALAELNASGALVSALRKVVANAAAAPLFRLFATLQGVADPPDLNEPWLGATLTQASDEASNATSESMLHDELFETYWRWRAQRPNPGWCLDTWPEK